MSTLRNFPSCTNYRTDCNCAKKEGDDIYCIGLQDTDFGDKPCPFFKTEEQVENERDHTIKILKERKRYDLIEKHYPSYCTRRYA